MDKRNLPGKNQKYCPFSRKRPRSPSQGREKELGRERKITCWGSVRGTRTKGKERKLYRDPKAAQEVEAAADREATSKLQRHNRRRDGRTTRKLIANQEPPARPQEGRRSASSTSKTSPKEDETYLDPGASPSSTTWCLTLQNEERTRKNEGEGQRPGKRSERQRQRCERQRIIRRQRPRTWIYGDAAYLRICLNMISQSQAPIFVNDQTDGPNSMRVCKTIKAQNPPIYQVVDGGGHGARRVHQAEHQALLQILSPQIHSTWTIS